MSQTPTTIRIDPQLKNEACDIYKELGISFSAAVSAFLKATIRAQGLPFEMKLNDAAEATTDSSSFSNWPNEKGQCSSSSKANNSSLNQAGKEKKDEFYTQYSDIEIEVENYRDQFENKTVFCNCDDAFESNFFRYFIRNFNSLKLKKLIATCYAHSSRKSTLSCFGDFLLPQTDHPVAYKAVVTLVDDGLIETESGDVDLVRLFQIPGNSIEILNGDGDFRSPESVNLLEASDIIVTNPPFSLFREFISQLTRFNKDFLIIGNINAITYKEVFPLIRENKVWLGASIHSGDRKFFVPDDYPLNAAGCGIDENGQRFIRVKGVRWFTNLDMPQRHERLPLKEEFSEENYPKYENYDAVNVSRTANIPFNYDGVMGVPITFLDKYSPDQFEILMLANGNVRANSSPEILKRVGYSKHDLDKGGVGIIDGKRSYARILIQRRKLEVA